MGETPHRRLPSKPSGLAHWSAPTAAQWRGVEVGCGARVLGATHVAQESDVGARLLQVSLPHPVATAALRSAVPDGEATTNTNHG
jgi:hypothetical protein